LGSFEEERATTELITGFDNGEPGLFIADAVDIQPTSLLEARNCFGCGRAKSACLAT
jgi:hypothetical protein